jgi:hypothetical protein
MRANKKRKETDMQKPVMEQDEALRAATERAEAAETELARLKHDLKITPTHSSDAEGMGSEAELRKDSVMAHLLDSLAAGHDIGHYGRLVFAMVGRHFLSTNEVVSRLTQDPDFSQADAISMMRQVEQHDYNPPKRERLLEWQQEQRFPILPEPDDPDCGNFYRNLKFPDHVYNHISEYQAQKNDGGVAKESTVTRA